MSALSRLLVRPISWRILSPFSFVRLIGRNATSVTSQHNESEMFDSVFERVFTSAKPYNHDNVKEYFLLHVRTQQSVEIFSQKLAEYRTRFSIQELSTIVLTLGRRMHKKSRSPAVSKAMKNLLMGVDEKWPPAELSQLACGMARAGVAVFADRRDLLVSGFVDGHGVESLKPLDLQCFVEALLYHRDRDLLKNADVKSLLERVTDRFDACMEQFHAETLLLLSNQLAKAGFSPKTSFMQRAEDLASNFLANVPDEELGLLARRLLPVNCLKIGAEGFRKELLQRASTLPDRSFVNIFAILGENQQIDGELLDKLCKVMPPIAKQFSVPAIVSFLDYLGRPNLRIMPEATSLGKVLEQVVYQTKDQFSVSDSCQALQYLSRLKSIERPVFKHLLRTALQDLDSVSLDDVATLADAVAFFNEERSTKKFLRALPRVRVNESSVTLFACRLVSDALVKLCAPQTNILQSIVNFLESFDMKELLISHQKDAQVILTNLAILVVSARVLFEDVGSTLNELSSTWHNSEVMVDLVWSCVSHSVYPTEALESIFSVTPKALRRWSSNSVVRLQQLHAIMTTRLHSGIQTRLSKQAFSEMLTLLKRSGNLSPPEGARYCLKAVRRLVGADALQLNLMTEEGSVVYGALLLNPQGSVASWPSDLSSVTQLWFQQHHMRPVAIMPFGKTFFAHPYSTGARGARTNQMLGTLIMRIRALQQAGWDFVLIPWHVWVKSADQKAFLQKCLLSVGVRVTR